MVTLTNTTNQVAIVLLEHPTFHRGAWGFEQRSIRVFEQAADGTVSPRQVRRVHPGSLRLSPGESRELPDDVLKIESVAAAIKRGKLRAERSKVAPAPAPQAAPEPSFSSYKNTKKKD